MSVTDLLLKAVGSKKKHTENSGLLFMEYYMHSMGDKIILQKVGGGSDDITVEFNKVCIRRTNMTDSFLIGKDDQFTQGSKCELVSIDANGIHYVINDTWEPDIEACVADRILKSSEMNPNLDEQFVYAKLWATGSLEVININGENTVLRPAEWENVSGAKIEPGFWYNASIEWGRELIGPAMVKLNWGIAPPLGYYIEQAAMNRDSIQSADVSLSNDGIGDRYTVIEMNENIVLNSIGNGEDRAIPANRVLIRRHNWDQYFVYMAGDYIANGSPCEFDGITDSGMYLLTNDTWDPGSGVVVADRIHRTCIMIPEYVLEDVFIMKRKDGSMLIINERGEYAERAIGEYTMLSEQNLRENIWYSATMEWENKNTQYPILSTHSDQVAPTFSQYLKKKGYEI